MSLDICNINNWATAGQPAKYLPNNYSSNLNFTRFSSITIENSTILQARECLIKGFGGSTDGIYSITANALTIIGAMKISNINCSNLLIDGTLMGQGRESPNININITNPSGNISIINGGISPYIDTKISGIGSINVSSNSYLSKIKQCISEYFLDLNKQIECSRSVPQQSGGSIFIGSAYIGSSMTVNAGYVRLTNSQNYGNIDAYCELSYSQNYGKINDVCVLRDSENYGEISGPSVSLYSNTINKGLLLAKNNVFADGTTNEGKVLGDCYFLDEAINKPSGLCIGTCFLLGGFNKGIIVGNTIISGIGVNEGTLSGNVTIYPGGTNDSLIIGSVNATQGYLYGSIQGNLSAKNCQGGPLHASGQSSFVECNIFDLQAIGNIDAKSTFLLGQVSCSGSFINCENSSIENGFLITNNSRFRLSSNRASISGESLGGNTIFESGSTNYGRLYKGVNAVFTFATNEGQIDSGIITFNNSTNVGNIFGENISFDKSINSGDVGSISNISLSNSSFNQGYMFVAEGEEVTFDQSVNFGTVVGSARFSNKSVNYGIIDGNATFDNTSFNDGTVNGECIGSGC